MTLLSETRQPAMLRGAIRRAVVHNNRRDNSAELEGELHRLERDIRSYTVRIRNLAEELGARYAVFRCITNEYDDDSQERGDDIIKLSRQTDEYIRTVYDLEQRRRELLDQIGG